MARRAALIAIGVAGLVGGCANQGQPGGAQASAPDEAPPANYRQIVAASARDTFVDPYSIRDAEIAPPKRAMGPSMNADGFTTPWVVCIRANAKNRMGGYTGRKITAFAVSGGKVVNTWDEAQYSNMVCGDARYEPFPELESIGSPATATKQAR